MKPSLKTSMKIKGLKIATALEGTATRMVLTAFKAISTCTCFAIDRASKSSRARNKYFN